MSEYIVHSTSKFWVRVI